MNQVTLLGRLGGDPEMTQTKGGVAIAKFSLATSRSYKDEAGQWQEFTTWHRIEVFRHLAERAAALRKGNMVVIFGALHVHTWEPEPGVKRSSVTIVAEKMYEARHLPSVEEAQTPAPDYLNQPAAFTEDDIPF